MPIQQRQQLHMHCAMRTTPMLKMLPGREAEVKPPCPPTFWPHCKGISVLLTSVQNMIVSLDVPRKYVYTRHLKKETHAARWGLLRGYSGKATKWVDFAVDDSTRRESFHAG
jgi:hypothetical protein